MESHQEAKLWDDTFTLAERMLGLPIGTFKATVLIETLPAAFEMDEILYAMKNHIVGLNCGRWDYIFSYIKRIGGNADYLLPDRGQVGMGEAFLKAYSLLLIKTCHRRGAHAMGGMAAQIPVKNDEAANDAAFNKVRADKDREASNGHDGTWVAHPALVPVAKGIFDALMPQANQIHRNRDDITITREDLLAPHKGDTTEEGIRENIRVGIQYIGAWLCGRGAVPLYNLMEDAATAEISRTQIWQQLKHGAKLNDGRVIDEALINSLYADEMAKLRTTLGEQAFTAGRLDEAGILFLDLVYSDTFTEFLTTPSLCADQVILRPPQNHQYTPRRVPMSKTFEDLIPNTPKDRFKYIERNYSVDDVLRLRGSVQVQHTLADRGSRKLWDLLPKPKDYVHSLGAMTGKPGHANGAGGPESDLTFPAGKLQQTATQHPACTLIKAFIRQMQRLSLQSALTAPCNAPDQIEHAEGGAKRDWFAPIVADAEAGFGGKLNSFEIMKAFIEAGVAGVHFEDQLGC